MYIYIYIYVYMCANVLWESLLGICYIRQTKSQTLDLGLKLSPSPFVPVRARTKHTLQRSPTFPASSSALSRACLSKSF